MQLCGFGYFIMSNHSLKNKFKILFILLKINLKFFFLSKLFKFKSERFLGYKINGFDYLSIRFLFEEIFYKNEYSFESDNKSPIIFDCGANIGFATLFFKWIYPESEVYAFEPDKDTFEVLKKNISQNKLKNVYLFNSAIYNKDGEIDFFIDSKIPGSFGMSTRQERIPKDKIKVNCISLSSLIKDKKINQVDFIKMDIEGSEKEAIEDLDRNNQLTKIMKLTVEYHHKIDHRSNLSEFLWIFEKNGFEYQIDAKNIPINSENRFQDILLYLYK